MAEALKDSKVEWVGKIPLSWTVTKNKYCFTNKKQLVGEKWDETQLLSLTKNGVKKKDINDRGGKQPDSFSTYQYVVPNQIVMCLFDLDQSAVFSGISQYGGMISPAYKVLTCMNNTIPKYISYWFDFVFQRRKFKTYSKNIRYTLDYDEFGKLPIILPPKDEQEKIADFLDEKCGEIDNLSEDIKKQIETLRDYKKSVITRAVTKGLDETVKIKDSGIEWIGEMPEHWKVSRVKYLFKFGKGLNITKTDLTPDGLPVISYGQIHSKLNDGVSLDDRLLRFTDVKLKDRFPQCEVKQNDFVFADTSEDYDGCGNCVLKRNSSTIFAGYHSIILKSKKQIDNRYLAYLFQTDNWRKQIRTAVSGVKVFSITQNVLSRASVVLPPESERKEIADFLDKICAEIDEAIIGKEQQLTKLVDYKKSIIYEYVTGKKRVKGAL